MNTELTRTPAMIAGEINTIKEQVRNTALNASVEIGRRLQEVKELVADGEWTAWLEENVDYSVRTAQNLMALAAEYDAGHAQALAGLNYTKAVLLLSVPREEREEFMDAHDVEGMSTRELQKTIADLRREKEGMQLTIDQLIKEQVENDRTALEDQVNDLKTRLEKANTAVETAKDVNRENERRAKELRDKLKQANSETEKARAEALEEKQRLEKALADAEKPIIQQVTPPDVEEELKRLRARLAQSQEEQALRSGYELLKHSWERLERQLSELEARDAELAGRFRQAFARGLRMMADGFEGQAKSA